MAAYDVSVCALIRQLAMTDVSVLAWSQHQQFHHLHDIAFELMCECDAQLDTDELSPRLPQYIESSSHLSLSPDLRPGYPSIQSPRTLEWDYEGLLAVKREQPQHAARGAASRMLR